MKAIVLCPGQGSQKVGMGKDLAEAFPAARDVFRAADEALGTGLSKLMWEGPEDDLTLTHNAQPAILIHTLATWAVVKDRLTPVAGAGHSLGEYSAYVVAGSLSAESAAKLVRRRGELMLEAGKQRPGAMAAILGLASAQVEDACQAASGGGQVVVAANLNGPDQTVISGDPAAVEQAGAACKAAGAKRVLPLKVSGAFHSPLMATAQTALRETLAKVHLNDPKVPVIANATAEPVRDASTARRLLGDQLTAAVHWVASMERAASVAPGTTFVEVGPGSVLAGLVKRIVTGAQTLNLGTAQDVTAFMERAA
ncbi:MAG TPA: ACP S-malonyltransferase [Gemmatimonadales bacterium]